MIKAPSSGMPLWALSIMTAMRLGSSPEGRRSSLGALQRDEIRASLASAYNTGDRPPPICRLGRYGLGGSRPWNSVGTEWPASNLRWRASSQYNHLEALAAFLIKRRRRMVRRGAHPVAAVPRQHVAGCNGLLGQPWPPARSPCRSIVFFDEVSGLMAETCWVLGGRCVPLVSAVCLQ